MTTLYDTTSANVRQSNIPATSGAASGGALDNTYRITVRSSAIADKYYLQSIARRLLPGTRCAMCARSIIPGKDGVEIRKVRGARAAYFGNVMRCNLPWVCAVCASRISEDRRQELSAALRANPQLFPVLNTNTVVHHLAERLRVVLDRLARVGDAFSSGRAMQAIKEKHEIVGQVYTLEVTVGPNGWHPHRHNLLLCNWGAELVMMPEAERVRYLDERIGYLELDLWTHYKHVAERVGFEASPEAFDVRGGNDAVANYLAKFGRFPKVERPASMKWRVEDELTKAIVKKGRGENRSPWQLLADCAEGDELSGELFKEYAVAMKGSKVMHYSRGTRALLGMGAEKSIAELVTEDDKRSDNLALLLPEQWRVVLKNGARAKVIEVAAAGDVAALLNYLNGLPGMEYHPVGVESWVADVSRELGAVLSVMEGGE